jgi:hypothetical protein
VDEINQIMSLANTLRWIGIGVVGISLGVGFPWTLRTRSKDRQSHLTGNLSCQEASLGSNPAASYDGSFRTSYRQLNTKPPTINLYIVLGTLLKSVALSVPAYFKRGGWALTTVLAFSGSLVGWLNGNYGIGWIVGVLVGVFAWFCGFCVYQTLDCTDRNSAERKKPHLIPMLLIGALLGSFLGALVLSATWIGLYNIQRVQYRSDMRSLLTLTGAILGLTVGLAASIFRSFRKFYSD